MQLDELGEKVLEALPQDPDRGALAAPVAIGEPDEGLVGAVAEERERRELVVRRLWSVAAANVEAR